MCHTCPLISEDQEPEGTLAHTPPMAMCAYCRAGLNTGSSDCRHTEVLGGGWSLDMTIQGQRAAKCLSSARNPGGLDSSLRLFLPSYCLLWDKLSKVHEMPFAKSNIKFLPNLINDA